MLEKIKANLFTIHGLVTSMLHGFLVVGMLASWIYFQVAWMGNDVSLSTLSPQSVRSHTGR